MSPSGRKSGRTPPGFEAAPPQQIFIGECRVIDHSSRHPIEDVTDAAKRAKQIRKPLPSFQEILQNSIDS